MKSDYSDIEQLPMFRENHPSLDGFSEHFKANISPQLKKFDDERVGKLSNADAIIAKDIVAKNVCGFLNWAYLNAFETGSKLADFKTSNLLPYHYLWGFIQCDPKLIYCRDLISGTITGLDFEMFKLRLDDRSGDSDAHKVTIFEGSLFRFPMKHNLSSDVLVVPDRKIFNPRRIKKMKRVGLEDPRFENKLEVYGADQVEARALLNPGFMQTVLKFERKLEAEKVYMAFKPDCFLLGVESKQKEGFQPKNVTEHVRSMTQFFLDEMCNVFQFVDAVMQLNGIDNP